MRPGAAAIMAVIVYGAFAGWHVFKAWPYAPLIAPGLMIIGTGAVCFVCVAGIAFPRLQKKELPKKKGLYRVLACAGFFVFVILAGLMEMAWESTVWSKLRIEETRGDSLATYKEKKALVRSVSWPVRSAGWVTCSLLFVAAQFFRPDPEPQRQKPEGRKPPPLPLADGMKSRVVTDKWWEKYH